MRSDPIVALDIETTGLDPENSRALAVALSDCASDEVLAGDDEDELLARVEDRIATLPGETILATWNGEAFDLPFLRRRFEIRGMTTSLDLSPRGVMGKYGQPRFEATWGGRRHVDIAYPYRDRAAELGVEWSLKPLARALGFDPVEVDRNGDAIARMSKDALAEYAASDARITALLARNMTTASLPAVG